MPYISPADRAKLIGNIERAIAASLNARASLLKEMAEGLLVLENASADRQRPRIRMQEFLNIVAILDSIDHDELPINYGASPVTRWAEWRRDPAAYLRQSDDAAQKAIWSLVERRLDQPTETKA